jgi:hypothetical protein
MTHILIFNFVLLGVCAFALVAGGGPERATAMVFLTAACSSYLVLQNDALHFEPKLVAIDLVALASLTAIALCANRFWPMYVSALQLITVAVHGVKVYDPSLATWMWMAAAGKLAYPTLVLLVIGVARHRERAERFGVDRSWLALSKAMVKT